MKRVVLTLFLNLTILITGSYVIPRISALLYPLPPDPTPITIHYEPPLTYSSYTITSKAPLQELSALVGKENIQMVLKLNRIDPQFVRTGSVLVVPSTYDWMRLSPFPAHIDILDTVPKLILLEQRIQAFAVYEHGDLVRWGPISSGKQSTPTTNGLYYTNWKSEWIRSTDNYDWILKWNFNFDNIVGVGMHEYELPGYPASHSCIRMTADDARWLYDWADQWVLSKSGSSILKTGTPVLVTGTYEFAHIAPWKKLPQDPHETSLSIETITPLIQPVLEKIQK